MDDVAVGWTAGAAGELFVAGRVDDDGVVEGACLGFSHYGCISQCFLILIYCIFDCWAWKAQEIYIALLCD